MSYGSLRWACRGCREVLKCDFIKIQTIWLVGLLVSAVLFSFLTSYFGWGLFQVIYLIANFVFFLFTLFYVKFEKHT